MDFVFLLPAALGFGITLTVWTALRLVIWARSPQNIAGALSLLGITLIMMGYLYQLVLHGFEETFFWMKIQGLGYSLLFSFWLAFVLFLTGTQKRLPRLLGVLIGVQTLTALAFVFLPANPIWFIQLPEIIPFGPFVVYRQQVGWLAMAAGLAGQAEGIASMVVLYRLMRRMRTLYRRHILALFLALALIFIAGLAGYLEITPVAPFFPVALAMIPVSLIISWVVFSLRVGQVLPVIRERVVENMHDCVLVLDQNLEVAYLNPAAISLLRPGRQAASQKLIGLALADLSPELAACMTYHPGSPTRQDTQPASVNIGDLVYSISRSFLEDWQGRISGQILVLRNITSQEKLEKTLQTRAADLARSSAFTEALSMVAAKISTSTELNQVYQTLQQELKRISLDFAVALREEGQPHCRTSFLSLHSGLVRQIESLAGMKISDFKLPVFSELTRTNAVVTNEALFYDNVVRSLREVFNFLPEGLLMTLTKTAGISERQAGFAFRLSHEEEDLGIFCVWGEALRVEDVPALSIFAAQVSAAIQKIRLIERERARVVELERVNRFMTTLSEVAASFEAELTRQQIMEVIGENLRLLGANCVIALIDPQTNQLVGHYHSVSSSVWRACEKLTGTTLTAFQIPYSKLRSLNSDSSGPAFLIEDPVEFASKVVHGLPRMVLRKTIRMVGISPEKPASWVPLNAHGRNIGVLFIWGMPQSQAFLTAITLFGRQAASALEKARLTNELEQLKVFNEDIVQGVAEAIVILDASQTISFANPAAEKMFGRPAAEILGTSWREYLPVEEHERVAQMLAKPGSQSKTGIELTVISKDGGIIPVLVNAQPRLADQKGKSILISLTDIEQRVAAEQQIRASMQEKEAMLKEIHHRVKNNLQIITSLLNLQSNQLEDEVSIEFFRESQTRIRSMALIHEKLYRSDNLARIQFDEYIRELGSFLLHTYSQASRNIRLDVQAEPIELDLDTAIPCSLIINELVSNSLKYGFPAEPDARQNASRQITVQLSQQDGSRVRLVVEDSGSGFPPELDTLKTKSLGLQLVNLLTRQLGGELSFSNCPGARVEIAFTAA